MAELPVETALPENPAPAGTSSGAGATGGGVAAQIALEHGAQLGTPPRAGRVEPIRKRIGRPPTHGRYSKAAGSDGKNPVRLPDPPDPCPGEAFIDSVKREMESGSAPAGDSLGAESRITLPPELFAELVSSGIETLENFGQSLIAGKATQAGLTPEEVAPQLARAKVPDRTRELIGRLSPLASQEIGLDPNSISPCAAIAALLAGPAFAGTTAYLTLCRLAKERASLTGKTKSPTPANGN